MLNRRLALAAIASGGLGSILAGCGRSRHSEEELVREWFRSVHQVDLADQDVKEILEYIHHRRLGPDDPACDAFQSRGRC